MQASYSPSARVRLQNERLFWGITLLVVLLGTPIPTLAGGEAAMSISMPPPILFAAPPTVIVIPETYVYVVPSVDADIFFYEGWWWRSWEGRWYRSPYYDSGWAYYQSVPSFYGGVPSGWRNDYRDHRWGGQPWNYQPIPHQQLQQNWSSWEKKRHWEEQTWGVQGLKPRTQPQQPSRAVQPKAQAKPQDRAAVKTQQSRPSQAAQPKAQAKLQDRVAAKPQQSRPPQAVQPKAQAKPQVKKAAKPQQAKPLQEKPAGGEEKQQERK